MIRSFFFLFTFSFLLVSCSMTSTVISMTEPVLENSIEALYNETDTEFAKQALPGNLKLLEGFWKSDPGNEKLLLILVQGYSAYALGYLEDEEPKRARDFYYRSWNFARKLFDDHPVLKDGAKHTPKEIEEVLKKMDKEDVDRLFWLGLSWGSYINFSISDPEVVVDLSKAQSIMNRVIELDESYYYGGAHMFWGTYYASVPQLLGGKPEKSLQHFEKAFSYSDGKFLFAKYFFAKAYAYQIQDKELFRKTLQEIINADPHILPGMELPNMLAKNRAKALLREADILF